MHLDPRSGVIADVTTVPLHLEPPPWCVHNGSTISWRTPHSETQQSARRWTRMVRVRVTVHVRVVTPHETEPDGNS